jgi:hypothetical protein
VVCRQLCAAAEKGALGSLKRRQLCGVPRQGACGGVDSVGLVSASAVLGGVDCEAV